MIAKIEDPNEKKAISRRILEELPEWFGIPEAMEKYICDSADQCFFAAIAENIAVGFLCLRETGRDTVELAVMGVMREFQRRGLGRALVSRAKEEAASAGYSFLQVKTVEMGHYDEYDDTNQFYLSLGFREFEVFPELWDEWNPCQIYVMTLK